MNAKICVLDLHRVYKTFSMGNETKLVKPANQGIPNPPGGEEPFVNRVMTSVESALSVLKESFSAYEAKALEILKEAKEKQDLSQAPVFLLQAQNQISKRSLEAIVDSKSRASKEIDEAKCANAQLKPALEKTSTDVKKIIKEGRKKAFSILNKVAFEPNLYPKHYRTEIEKAEKIIKTSVFNANLEVDKLLEQFSKAEGSIVCHLLSKGRVWIELNGEEFNLRTNAPLETFPERTEFIIGDGIDQLRLVIKRVNEGSLKAKLSPPCEAQRSSMFGYGMFGEGHIPMLGEEQFPIFPKSDNTSLLKAKLSPIPFLEKDYREHLVKEFKTLFDVKYGLNFDENPLIQGIVSALLQPADFCNFYEVLRLFKNPDVDLSLTAEQKNSVYVALLGALDKTEAANKDALISLLCRVAKIDSKLKSQWYRWYVWKADVHYGENLFQKNVQGAAKEALKQWKEYPIATFVEPNFLDSEEKIRIRKLKEKHLFLKNELEQKKAEVQELKDHKRELAQRLRDNK